MLLEMTECVRFYSETEKCDILLALDADGYNCWCYEIKDGVVHDPCYHGSGWVFTLAGGMIDSTTRARPDSTCIEISYEEFMKRTAPPVIHGLKLEDLL